LDHLQGKLSLKEDTFKQEMDDKDLQVKTIEVKFREQIESQVQSIVFIFYAFFLMFIKDEESEIYKKENEILMEQNLENKKKLDEYTLKFDEYKEKINNTNETFTQYKADLEEVSYCNIDMKIFCCIFVITVI
jgi:hypothetical protein